MVLTLNAKWEQVELVRGVAVYRRIVRTGTSGGRWMAGGSLFDTKARALEYVNSIPDDSIRLYQLKAQ